MLILAVTFSTHNHWISPVSTVPYNPVAFNTTEDDEEAGLPVPNPWKEMGDASNVAIIGKAFIILSETLILSFTLIMIVHRLIVLDSANRTAVSSEIRNYCASLQQPITEFNRFF